MKKTITTKNAMLRYSIVQFVLWAQFCCCANFAAVFLEGRSVNSAWIGITFAAGNIMAFAVQPFVSSLADSGEKITITQIIMLISGLMLATELLTFVPGFPGAVLVALYSIIFMLLQCLPALVNGLAIYYTDRGAKINYGISRGLGSISFALLSVILGRLVAVTSYHAVGIAQATLAAVMLAILFTMPSPRNVKLSDEKADDAEAISSGSRNVGNKPLENVKDTSYLHFVKANPWFMLFFISTGLTMILYMFYNNFTIQVVENVGVGSREMGILLGIAAMSEVPMMFLFDVFAKRLEVKWLLMISVVGFNARGALMTLAMGAAGLYAASIMQFLGFAMYMPAIVRFSDEYFGEGDKNKALGLLQSTMVFGSIVGSLVGGPLIDTAGVGIIMKVMLAFSVLGSTVASICLIKMKK